MHGAGHKFRVSSLVFAFEFMRFRIEFQSVHVDHDHRLALGQIDGGYSEIQEFSGLIATLLIHLAIKERGNKPLPSCH